MHGGPDFDGNGEFLSLSAVTNPLYFQPFKAFAWQMYALSLILLIAKVCVCVCYVAIRRPFVFICFDSW